MYTNSISSALNRYFITYVEKLKDYIAQFASALLKS